MALRYDTASIEKATRTDAGFLRAPATLTRAGVFEYRQPNGQVRRELRLPEEVFRADSLDSLLAAPLTLEHPTEAVTPANARKLAVGHVGTDVRQDGDFVRATVMVTDGDAIAAIDQGRMQELSCGYRCDLEETPGEWNGQPYDAIQRGVVYNHVALVPEGRAGPEVRLHLDAADAVMVPPSAPKGRQESPQMKKIRIDGVDFEAPDQTAQAVEQRIAALEQKVADLTESLTAKTADADKMEAERDAAKEEAQQAEEARADALKPERLQAAVRARVALETTGREILGAEFKADASDLDIRKAVIAKLAPAAKLDGKNEAYIEARFDQALEQHKASPNPALGNLRQRADEAPVVTNTDAATKRAEMLKRNAEAYKQPLTATKAGR